MDCGAGHSKNESLMFTKILAALKQPFWIARLALAVIAMTGYLLTLSPSTSFWDCGEFLTATHVLGIPHPPGTPFYLILGRTWELLFAWAGTVAYRGNLLSAVSSVIGALLAFEITREILRTWSLTEIMKAALSFMAGGLLAFSDTYWFNATETEIYGTSIALMLTGVYALLRWDRDTTAQKNRWLIFFVYISFLSMGLHTNSMIPFPLAWLFIGVRTQRLKPWIWLWSLVGLGLGALVLLLIHPELLANYAFMGALALSAIVLLVLAWQRGEITDFPFWILGAFLFTVVFLVQPFLEALALAILLQGGLVAYNKLRKHTELSLPNQLGSSLALGLLLAALVGFSVELVLPVRAHTSPVLNESNPVTWERVRDAIERKQYGSMGMFERALWRRADPAAQLGFSDRIGYLGYQLNQFSPAPMGAQVSFRLDRVLQVGGVAWLQFAHRLLWESVFVLVLLSGLLFWRRPQALLIYGLFIVTALGLVFYVNFADGSKPDSQEARRWMQRMAEYKADVVDPSIPSLPNLPKDVKPLGALPSLPSMMQIRAAIDAWHQTGKQDSTMGKIMAWERTGALKGIHFPIPPTAVHREVRERDYFYTPAFVFFAVLFALALALLAERKPSLWVQRSVLFLGCGLWVLPFATHFEMHNRSHDFVPREFAWNMLQSVPAQGLLITFGDNDTFPLWYLQQVEGVRRDVTVINASLAQMDWYQEQILRQRPDLLVTKGIAQRQDLSFKLAFSRRMTVDTTSWFYAGDSTWHPSAADQFMMEIVTQNWPRIPICFTYNAAPEDLPGGAKYGFTWSPVTGLVRQLGIEKKNADSLLIARMESDYLLSGFTTPNWRYQESTMRAGLNYRNLLRLALSSTHSADDIAKLATRGINFAD